MTGWCTGLTLWSRGNITLFVQHTLKLHGQGHQTGAQRLPAFYTVDAKNAQRWIGFLFSITHLLKESGQCHFQGGTKRNIPPTGVNRHAMRQDVLSRLSREKAHGSLTASHLVHTGFEWPVPEILLTGVRV